MDQYGSRRLQRLFWVLIGWFLLLSLLLLLEVVRH